MSRRLCNVNNINFLFFFNFYRYFNSVNITDVVRLNEPMYDRNKFLRYGIKHHELQYPDGGLPTDKIILYIIYIYYK